MSIKFEMKRFRVVFLKFLPQVDEAKFFFLVFVSSESEWSFLSDNIFS